MGLEDLNYDLVVITPAGTILTTKEYVRGVVVATQWHILFTYFTVLPMREFNAIFRMTWMLRY